MENNVNPIIPTAITVIEICTGIHQPSGLPMVELFDVRTEPLNAYKDCSISEQLQVRNAMHRYQVARAEAESRLRRFGINPRYIRECVLKWSDELFFAYRRSAADFCDIYARATEEYDSIGDESES